MMTTILTETEAAALEGFVPISKEALTLQRRYHTLANRMGPLKAEQDAIKALLTEEMNKNGAKALTYKGVPVVSLDTVKGKDVDWDGILAAFPTVVQFIGVKVSNRFNAKKRA